MMSNEEISPTTLQQQFSHSVKVKETAKGIRGSRPCIYSDEEETITSVLQTYQKTIARFEEQGHVLAPMENGGTTQQ